MSQSGGDQGRPPVPGRSSHDGAEKSRERHDGGIMVELKSLISHAHVRRQDKGQTLKTSLPSFRDQETSVYDYLGT